MADKKVTVAVKDKDEQILKLQRKVEESQVLLSKKEREFEQTMDALQSDIDSLEAEKVSMQTKVSNLTKKQMYDSLTRGSASPSSSSSSLGELAISRLYQESFLWRHHMAFHSSISVGLGPDRFDSYCQYHQFSKKL